MSGSVMYDPDEPNASLDSAVYYSQLTPGQRLLRARSLSLMLPSPALGTQQKGRAMLKQ